MKKKVNIFGQPYGVFYTEEEEYNLKVELLNHIRDIIVSTLGTNHITCTYEQITDTSFKVMYNNMFIIVEVITPTYIKVIDSASSNLIFYLTEDKVDEFIRESLDSNLVLFK